jgi:hypothetical protein
MPTAAQKLGFTHSANTIPALPGDDLVGIAKKAADVEPTPNQYASI